MRITTSRGLAAAAALGVALTGLGTAPAASAATGTSVRTAAADPQGRPPPCTAEDLNGTLRALNPGAGQRHAILRLRNTGGRVCWSGGHVLLRLNDARGRDLPTRNVWTGGGADHTLNPGDSLFTRLDWTVVPGPGEPVLGSCEPSPSWLSVTPPHGGRMSGLVAWPYGPVCEHGTITTGPLRPGIGPVY